jgi:hypothetical protein
LRVSIWALILSWKDHLLDQHCKFSLTWHESPTKILPKIARKILFEVLHVSPRSFKLTLSSHWVTGHVHFNFIIIFGSRLFNEFYHSRQSLRNWRSRSVIKVCQRRCSLINRLILFAKSSMSSEGNGILGGKN